LAGNVGWLHKATGAIGNNWKTKNANRKGEATANIMIDLFKVFFAAGLIPWQYPDGAFLSLCHDCHTRRGKVELRFRMFMTRLKVGTLEQIRKDYRGQTIAA
jgi:hypothetical protein